MSDTSRCDGSMTPRFFGLCLVRLARDLRVLLRFITDGVDAYPIQHLSHLTLAQFCGHTSLQARRQGDYTEAHAHQPAHRQSQCVEGTAHHAVTTFFKHHTIPMVITFATFVM